MTRNHSRMLHLWETQGGACHWCGRPMYRDGDCPGGPRSPWYGSVEHLLRRGEPGYREGVAAAHIYCNALREILSSEEFAAYVQGEEFAALYQRTFGRRRTMASPKLKGVIRQIARSDRTRRERR